MLTTKRLFVIALSCLVMSCGLLKIAYNRAPDLAVWWLDDYFNLNTKQKTALTLGLQKLHSWHRQTQLPAYQTLLTELQTSLGKDDINALEVCEKIETVNQQVRIIQTESIPIILQTSLMLNEQQIAYFKSKLEKRSAKWKDEWWPSRKQEQLDVRYEKAKDFAEDVYGSLNEVQLSLLKRSISEKNVKPELIYAEIQRRNEDSVAILSSLQNPKLSHDEKTKLLNEGFDRIQKSPNPAYLQHANVLTQQTCETISALHASTNAEQKSYVINRLQNYIEQISDLQTQ